MRLARILALAFCLSAWPSWGLAQRVALLIGINNYPDLKLKNAANDATDLAKTLEAAGFQTVVVIDADRKRAIEALADLGKKAAGAEAVFFFFAGNAVQFDTRMFLIPSDGRTDAAHETSIELANVFKLIGEGKPRAAFVVLDTNRDTPHAAPSAGRSQASGDPPVPPNTLVAYGTSVGGIATDGFGRNGLFTKHILQQIRAPGLAAELVFKRARQGVIRESRGLQIPQESSSLAGDFSFFAATPFDAGSQPPSPPTVLAPPAGEKRVALVVGNAAYKVAPLVNTLHDASDVAEALRLAGFRVILRKDASQREMKAAIREFERELAKSDVGLFYFAGHGLQIRGNNFLVPVDADMQSEADAEDQSVDANFVLRVLDDAQTKVGIVILDACRNNPLPRRTRAPVLGLAQMNAATGTLIAFATSPGSTAIDGLGVDRNGVYVKHLLRSLDHEDTDILKVFQRTRAGVVFETKGAQVPWESTSLMGDFRFRVRVPAK